MRFIVIVLFQLLLFCPAPSQGQDAAEGSYALVAGGSKGIGFAIAEALAKRNYNLVLIARGPDTLAIAKTRLEKKYQIKVETLSYDLSLESSAPAIADWCKKKNLKLKVLCNVAGLGGQDDYLKLSLDSVRYMVNLNVESGVALTMLLIPLLEQNAPSYILNVASLAGLAPIPSKNIYAATKAAVIYFSYGLRYQLKRKDIKVSCLAPGPVFTRPAIKRETARTLGWIGLQMAVTPERVGEVAVKRTLRGRMLIIPGTLAKLSSVMIRILPRRVAAGIYYGVDKK
jgi:uncharacterized protein